jgi:hypothetical protein
MKTILSIAAVTMFCSCYSYKETQIQMQMKSMELVKIDTISRYDRKEQLLTWKSQDNMVFTSYAALGPVFVVGSKATVFVQR